MMHCTVSTDQGRFPFNLKFRKIWLVHQMEWTISVWSDQLYARPALKVVHFDRSCYLGQSDRNVPFHLTKLLSPVPLFCILLTRTITKCTVAWVGSVQPQCTVLCGISKMSNRNFGWMESASGLPPSPNLWNNLQPRQNKAANTVKFRK